MKEKIAKSGLAATVKSVFSRRKFFRRAAVGTAAAERADVDAVGSAVDRVRARIAGLVQDLFRLDDLVNLGLCWMRLGIDDVETGRPQAWNDEIPSLDERVTGERRER